MASLIIPSSTHSSLQLIHKSSTPPLYSPVSTCIRFSGQLGRRKYRGLSVVRRASPGVNSYVFAFVIPLTLLAVTVFASIRVADKLDRDFLEELELNREILEAEKEDDNDEDSGNVGISIEEEEPSVPSTRNRPKREAEPSAM